MKKQAAPAQAPSVEARQYPLQEKVWKSLLAFGDSAEKLPQALLLLGPQGVGKLYHARRFYQWIHCSSRQGIYPCDECTACLKIMHGNHPDIIEVGPTGEQIHIEDLREMKTRLFFPPVEGRLRLVIIKDAHKLNAASANSILKTLEEPPAHTRFFLLTSEKSLLLPTIQSRSQFLYFAPVASGEVRAALLESAGQKGLKLNETTLSLLTQLCGDGLSRIDTLLSDAVIEFLNEYVSGSKLPRTLAQASALADELSATSESWKLELLIDLLTIRGREAASHFAQQGDLERVYALTAQTMKAAQLRRRLERNPNRKLVALEAALHLGSSS